MEERQEGRMVPRRRIQFPFISTSLSKSGQEKVVICLSPASLTFLFLLLSPPIHKYSSNETAPVDKSLGDGDEGSMSELVKCFGYVQSSEEVI